MSKSYKLMINTKLKFLTSNQAFLLVKYEIAVEPHHYQYYTMIATIQHA